jgi:hypothetical protein
MTKSKNDKFGMKSDTEGYMSSVELDTIEQNITILRKKIKNKKQQLPAWIQSKITRAADFTTDAAQYLNTGKELEESSFKINPETHSRPAAGTKAKSKIPTSKLTPEINNKVKAPVLPKFSTESTIVDRILNSLNEEEDCPCPESKKEKEKGYVKGSKPVMSVEDIAGKHGVSPARIQKQLKMGIKVEGEHTTNKEEAEGIALQHLAEKPNYYTELKKVEKIQSESTIVTDLFGNPKFEFIDLVLPSSLKEARKMKGEDPCWKGYEMVGTKKKRGKKVPNCVPVTEATLPVQNGQVMQILFSWRGKTMTSQLFFPQIRIPNRKEVTDAIVKVYPDAKVLNYKVGNQNVGQPIIQLPNTKSKNYLLQNKTIGEEVEVDEGFLDNLRNKVKEKRVEKARAERDSRRPNKSAASDTEPKPGCDITPHLTRLDKRMVAHDDREARKFDLKKIQEDGPSLSVSRGEKLSVEAGSGLTEKGREKYNRATGSNLKAPVTGKVKKGSKAWKRRKNFCSRSRSWKRPRGLAARRRWKC